MRYRCGRCNFRFEPKGNRPPARCPYCSKDDKLLVDEDVNDILQN